MDVMVDGVRYESWDEVPGALRTAIATSGILPWPGQTGPGALDGQAHGSPPTAAPPVRPVSFSLDGRTYQSIDDVPGEVREALRAQLLATPPPTVEPRLPRALAAAGAPAMPAHGIPAATDTPDPVDHWSSTTVTATRSPIVTLTIAVVVLVVIAALVGMNLKP